MELTEPRGFWRAHATGMVLERGAPMLTAHDVSAASVYAGDLVAHEVRDGERRAMERASAAAERVRQALDRPRGGNS